MKAIDVPMGAWFKFKSPDDGMVYTGCRVAWEGVDWGLGNLEHESICVFTNYTGWDWGCEQLPNNTKVKLL